MKKILLIAALAVSVSTYVVSENINSQETTLTNAPSKRVRKELDNLKDFEKIGLGVSADIVLTQGSSFKVVYEGSEKLYNKLKFEIRNNGLDINYAEKNNWGYSDDNATIYITMPNLSAIALGGSGDIESTNDFNLDNLSVALGGSGDIRLKGNAKSISVAIGGSGDVDLSRLSAKNCKIAISGSGDCDVKVSEKLDVVISGSGDVNCKGNPTLKKSISGSGEVSLNN